MEIPSSTEWNSFSQDHTFSPNYFVDISKSIKTKLEALSAYSDELRNFPHPRSIEGVNSLGKWRGSTVGVDFAESFIAGRIIV